MRQLHKTLPALFATLLASQLVLLTPSAQVRPDTLEYALEPVVVNAERYTGFLNRSTSTVSVIKPEDFDNIPTSGISDLVGLMPGIGFLGVDGTGREPQGTIRGFYGGGDVEYLVVLLDGVVINQAESGLIPWDFIPYDQVENVELLRGGSSSLYGDAAIGGVLNITTRNPQQPGGRLTLSGGSYESGSGALSIWNNVSGIPIRLSGNYDRTSGYRENGNRTSGSGSIHARLYNANNVTISVDGRASWRLLDQPGPLVAFDTLDTFAPSQPRTDVSPFFSFDNIDEKQQSLSVTATGKSQKLTWKGSLAGRLTNSAARKTLALATFFADTKDRTLDSELFSASGSVDYSIVPGVQAIAGIDLSRNHYMSEYYQVFGGGAADYSAMDAVERGDLDEQGDATRLSVGVYAQIQAEIAERLLLTGGVRADRLEDDFDPSGASSDNPTTSTTHDAVSPKLGLNLELANSKQATSNIYVSIGQSFKAPAIDQLYDQRNIPVEFPPFEISTSSSTLKPQRGKHFELGTYTSFVLPSFGRAELTATVYRIDMRDELDFSFETFSLVNIGKSRHDGLEVGLRGDHRSGLSAFANYTLQSTTLENGDNKGQFVKAIPRDIVNGGISYQSQLGVGAGLTVKSARRIFLDDANEIPLSGHTTVDLQLSYSVGPIRLAGSVSNLFDEEYFATGFTDPAGSSDVFLFPAAGRSGRVQATYRW